MQDFTISINITSVCNIMCDYCSAYIPYDKNDKNIISENTIKIIVELVNKYLSDFNIIVIIVGGEPLTHLQLDNIIKQIRKIKNLDHIEICTNGSLLLNEIISNHAKIIYALSYHIDMIIDKNLENYSSHLIKNIEFLNNNKIPYILKILDKKEHYNELKLKQLATIKDLVSSDKIKYVKIRPTKQYHSNEKNIITNKHFNKLVYWCRAINITRAILPRINDKERTVGIYYSYICDMENLTKYISIYSIKSWKFLKNQYNESKLCQYPICQCPICQPVSN